MRLTMTSLPPDCDSDGVPDSLDILAGRADDVNHDGVDDYCDDDPAVRSETFSDHWKQLACLPDTVFFKARHQAGDEVWVRYTVPEGGARVSLQIAAPSGVMVKELVHGHQACGAYDYIWHQDDSWGRAVPDGTVYRLTLEMNGRSFTQTAFWRRRLSARH